jgi:hypothetical protein
MKTSYKSKNVLILFALFLLLAAMVTAQEVTVKKTTTPIEIDAVIEDIWNNVDKNVVENVVVGTVDDEYDLFGEWRALWDDNNFYYLIEVLDDELYDDSDGANENDDGLDLFFDTDNGDEATPDTDDLDDFLLTIEYSSGGVCELSGEKGSFPTLEVDEIEAVCTESAEGYIIEAAIPLAVLDIPGGGTFGFGVRINDDDVGGNRESQIAWYMEDAGFWNVPSALADVELGAEEVSPNAVIHTTIGTQATVFSLAQNFPNPFNNATMINYQLPMNSKVILSIYTLLGQKVATLVNEVQPAGTYSVAFDGSDLNSGVYFYRLETNKVVSTKKLTLLK